MKRKWTRSVTALGVVVTGALLAAQAPLPAGQAQPPGEQAGAVQNPVFRITVDLVTTDVIVRDAQGQFVTDLEKNDFEVFEDGVAQEVTSLVLVHGGRVSNLAMPPPPPPAEGIILPPPRPPSDTSGRIFLLFIDDLHLDFKNTSRVKDLLKKIKDSLIHQGDMFGIVSTGTSSLAIDLTYDVKRIDEAIKKVMGGALKATDIIQGPDGAEGPSEVRYRAHVAFATAEDLMANLEKVHNRRKALIYVSNGYDFNPFVKSRLGEAGPYFENKMGTENRQQQSDDGTSGLQDPTNYNKQNAQFADADLARELAELTRSANRANTTIYTVDPRGLVGGPDLDENVDPTEYRQYIDNSINSLRVLAELTGGIAVVNQNDFERALKRIDAETSDYYMLGYYSTNPDPLKRTRQVEVKIKRTDIDVWSRKSYSLKRPPKG